MVEHDDVGVVDKLLLLLDEVLVPEEPLGCPFGELVGDVHFEHCAFTLVDLYLDFFFIPVEHVELGVARNMGVDEVVGSLFDVHESECVVVADSFIQKAYVLAGHDVEPGVLGAEGQMGTKATDLVLGQNFCVQTQKQIRRQMP